MRNHMSAAMAVVIGLLSLLMTHPAAAQSIRVLMSGTAQRVVATSPDGIRIESDQHELVMRSAVTVVATGTGLQIQGQSWSAQRVTLEPQVGDVSVLISDSEDLRAGTTRMKRGSGGATGPVLPASSIIVLPGRVHLVAAPLGLQVINELDLESYVAGVVPWEMNVAWHPEALKVQAVAARTYALYQQQATVGREYDVVAGTQDQVYRGRHTDPRVQVAVEETRGLIVVHGGRPILAAFSSTAAGATEDAMTVWAKDLPYLKGVDCPFDTSSPYYEWRASFKLEDLESGLRRQGLPIGTIATIAPLSYSATGRVARLRILHSAGELILRGEELRRAVGYTIIPSTLFEVDSIGPEVILSGRGAGHAVGLCQWGAKELASLGYPFSTILQYYFPETQLARLPSP